MRAKKRVAELYEAQFGPARERRAQLAADPAAVDRILAEGGRRARAIAQSVMRDVRKACGVVTGG